MARFVSRVPLIAAIGYAGLFATLLVAASHSADPEELAFFWLLIGFPWSLVSLGFPNHSGLVFYFGIFLNMVTVYVFALALVRIFSSGDQPNSRQTRLPEK